MFIGRKKRQLYIELIEQHFPKNIKVYVEPFGGSYAVHDYLENKPELSIYNDINKYDININADEIYNLDYTEIFNKFDSPETFFYIDPPYYNKEYLYENCEKYNDDFHIKLHDNIIKLKGKVIISYENRPFIINLYHDMIINRYYGSSLIFKNEIIITK